MRVTVYDEVWEVLKEEVLSAGDFLVFLEGGHSLTMLEKTRLIEVKQGPYLGDAEAKIYR